MHSPFQARQFPEMPARLPLSQADGWTLLQVFANIDRTGGAIEEIQNGLAELNQVRGALEEFKRELERRESDLNRLAQSLENQRRVIESKESQADFKLEMLRLREEFVAAQLTAQGPDLGAAFKAKIQELDESLAELAVGALGAESVPASAA